MRSQDEIIRAAEDVAGILESWGVVLKLYAGGTKSRADIVELLAHNPAADPTAIRDLCDGWRLGGIDALIDEALGGG